MTTTFDNQYPSAGRLAEMAAETTLDAGGGTFKSATLRMALLSRGYAVSATKAKTTVTLTGVRRYDVVAIARTIRAVRDDYATPYVGTWLDGSTVYVDPVVVLPDLDSALTLGRTMRQLAIFDFGAQAAIEVR